MNQEVIHFEASRSWWNGSSKTFCGMTLTRVYTADWFQGVTCPACKAAKKAGKK